MTFNNIDEYETYIEQVNEENYETLALQAEKEEQFNIMMKEMAKELEQPKETKIKKPYKTPTPTLKEEPLQKHRKEVKVVECILETDEYLGYLLGCAIIARLKDNWFLAGFYQGKYDKFVSDNTPK